MTAGRSERRPVKIRRRGRHTTPSQVEKVAVQAGKAAPAMAIAGALVTAPQAAHAATGTTAATRVAAGAARHSAATLSTVARQHAIAGQHAVARQHAAAGARAQSAYYKVRSGDTLSKIAGAYYHKTSDWKWLYHENRTRISNPDVIYPGQSLYVPADPPADYTLPHYQPRHANPSDSDTGGTVGHVVPQSASASGGRGATSLSGTLGCSGLERLWEDAGGNSSDAVMAASIAMAESDGDQYAVSPTSDYGYWQINASNGSLATFSPYGNARAAVILSGNGSDWSPWTTYTSGAYSGRC